MFLWSCVACARPQVVTEPGLSPTVILLFFLTHTHTLKKSSSRTAQLCVRCIQVLSCKSQTPEQENKIENRISWIFTVHCDWKLAESSPNLRIISKYLSTAGLTRWAAAGTAGRGSGLCPLVVGVGMPVCVGLWKWLTSQSVCRWRDCWQQPVFWLSKAMTEHFLWATPGCLSTYSNVTETLIVDFCVSARLIFSLFCSRNWSTKRERTQLSGFTFLKVCGF